MDNFSHLDEQGKLKMVDISSKPSTLREATAIGEIRLAPSTLELIWSEKVKKGNVLEAARLAGIMAAKRVSELIPLCHQVPLSHVKLEFEAGDEAIKIRATTKCRGTTGVEMEALTAVSVAGLTIYDMCKAVDKQMVIGGITLVSKTGGKTDFNLGKEVP